MTIQSSQFKGNTASQEGGALAVATESSVTVQDSLFTDNTATDSGGAMAVTAEASASIQVSRFEGNRALGLGGAALRVSASSVELFANIFIGNVADNGGGGALLWDGNRVPNVHTACFYGWFAEPGPANDGVSYCVPCPPGSYKDDVTTATCSQCDVGKYSNATAATSCSVCPAGTYADAVGASMCASCPDGSTSAPGSTSAADCSEDRRRLGKRDSKSGEKTPGSFTSSAPASLETHPKPQHPSKTGQESPPSPVLPRSKWGQDVPKRLSPSAILQGKPRTRSPPKVSSAHLPAPHQDLQQQHKNLIPIAPVAMTPGPGVRHKGASTAGSRHRRPILRSTDPPSPDSTTALAIAVSLSDLTHWLCDGGRLNPAPHNNSAGYGACVATPYDRLELQGVPTHQAPGYAGVPLELVVLKLDQYGQTIAADSSSALQMYAALASDTSKNDDSVSFVGGSLFAGFDRGRAVFPIGVKPTFSSVSVTDGRARAAAAALDLRSRHRHSHGRSDGDGPAAAGAPGLGQSHLLPCRLGAASRPIHRIQRQCRGSAGCVHPVRTRHVLVGPSGRPIRIDGSRLSQLPRRGRLHAGGDNVLFSTGNWSIVNGTYLLSSCPTGHKMITSSHDDQQCELCAKGEECTSKWCSTCTPCAAGYYKAVVGTEPCMACPANTYAEDTGATALILCQSARPGHRRRG